MRTSLRRLEATYRSSPREILKKKNVKAFVHRGKKLFRINGDKDINEIYEEIQTKISDFLNCAKNIGTN